MNKILITQCIAAVILAVVLAFVVNATSRQTKTIQDLILVTIDHNRVLNEQNALLRAQKADPICGR